MKKIGLFLIGLLFATNSIYGQFYQDYYMGPPPPLHLFGSPSYFSVGDMKYPTNYTGLKFLMRDLQTDNPELYAKLESDFQTIKNKRATAYTCLISGTAISGAFFIGAGIAGKRWVESNTIDGQDQADIGSGIGLAVIGGSFLLAGGILYAVFLPNESDYYNFMNVFNKNSPDKKLNWHWGLDYGENYHTVGLNLALTF